MATLQEVFARTQELKKKQKDIRSAYKDALALSMEYQELMEKMKMLREKRKQLEASIRDTFKDELTKLEDLAIDIASDAEMLTDMAMNMLMKGETVSVQDEYSNNYEPVFKVNFKKVV